MNRSADSILAALPLTRRGFLGVLAGGATLALGDLRFLIAGGPCALPVVVRSRHQDAVNWDFKTGWYGDHVSQPLVDALLDRALMELTGGSDVCAAWRSLLPGYAKGRKIAVKVNFNNSYSCSVSGNTIDSLAEVVNAIARGLGSAGVFEDDIWVYDAVRTLPDRFRTKLQAPGIVCWARSATCGARMALFSGTKPQSVIQFASAAVPNQTVTDVVVDADYVINVPITKRHSMAGLTLGYKNHFGTIQRCSDLHAAVSVGSASFSTGYNPLVEIMANPHVGPKTVLVLGDCLFGDPVGPAGTPRPWNLFGGRSPACIFAATDPVALDCVQRDLLYAERPLSTDSLSESYLKLAAQAGQGVFEATPGVGGYQAIDYRELDLAGTGWVERFGQGKPGTGGLVPRWRFAGVPAPGRSVVLEILDGPPGATAAIAVGRKETAVRFPLGTLLVDPLLVSFLVPLGPGGSAVIPLAIPGDPSVLATELTFQAFLPDAGAVQRVSHSEGLKLHIGR